MWLDVKTKVGACHSCHVNKKLGRSVKSKITPIPVTSQPWFDVHMDYCQLQDLTKNKKDRKASCLIMVDRFTKEVELCVTRNQKDKTSIRKFTKRILLRKGHCHSVTTDRGFGKEFADFLEEAHIHYHPSMPYRHVGNGLAERNVRSVREYLRHYLTPDSDLKEAVARCQFALNTAVKASTGLTPFRLITGDEVRTQVEMELCEPQPVPVVLDTPNIATVHDGKDKAPKVIILRNLLQQRQERMLEEQQLAMDNIKMSQMTMIKRDKANSNLRFQKGDLVYIDRHLPTRTVEEKSGTQTFGPYRVRGYGFMTTPHGTDEQNCPMCDKKILGRGEQSPYLLIENPWVGASSEFTVHEEDARLFKGPLPKVRELAVSEDLRTTDGTMGRLNLFQRVAKQFGTKVKDLSYLHLIGSRVWVRWTKGQGASGKWNGTVVDYEPLLKTHWILYDVADENGDAYFPQNLISNGASHNWGFLPTS